MSYVQPSRRTAALGVLFAFALTAACSHLKRDVEYNLVPTRPRVLDQPSVRVELIDISRHGRDNYLIVRIRVHNRTDEQAHFEPKQVLLVAGMQVRRSSEEFKENDVTGEDVEQLHRRLERLGDDIDDLDDDDSSSRSRDQDRDHRDRSDRDDNTGPIPDADDVRDIIHSGVHGAGDALRGSGEVITGTIKTGKFIIQGTYFVIKGSVLAVRGINDVLERSIQAARQRVDPGGYTELAIKFDDIPAKTDSLPSYLFFDSAMTLESGRPVDLPPLIVTNPQESHMGFEPPQRARLAAGLRFGGGGTWTSSEQVTMSKFLGVHAYIGPRVGPWSFTAVGTLGYGFMLGFDIRRDIVASSSVLSTLYLGYGRHWLYSTGGDLLDGRGARVGLEVMVPFSQRAYDWEVVTGGLGVYLEAAPMVMDDGTGVFITGGMSLLGW